MTDRRTDADAPRKASRRIPPLVWIVLALLVGWLVAMMVQRERTDALPEGGADQAPAATATATSPAPADRP
jgi:hypothetical protein